jgi:hypothetical protein
MIKDYFPCDFCKVSDTCYMPCLEKKNWMPDRRTKISIKDQAQELQELFDDYYLEDKIEESLFKAKLQDRLWLLWNDTRGME